MNKKKDPNDISLPRKLSGFACLIFLIAVILATILYFAGAEDDKFKHFLYGAAAMGALMGAVKQYAKYVESKKCPLCKQLVKKDAVKCNHCGGQIG